MHKQIIIFWFSIIFLSISWSDSSAQWTDFNQHDPGISTQVIPPWIKNTAGWWANNSISENEFLHAIQYLVENQIIKINAESIQGLPDITTTYTRPADRQIGFAQLTGSFEEKHTGPLTLTVIQPDNSEEVITTISRDGKFSTTMELKSNSQIGIYKVFGEIKGEQILLSAFEVKDRNSNKVPSWIKSNALWWSEDKITDENFTNGIEFLVENKIIILESNSVPKPAGPGKTMDGCEGNARCFSGKITQVIDGDTIRINDYPIRFALASAPELGELKGEEARDFIEDICPIGSEAKVDEDDGQTEGSYGRIVAVVYCNRMNLNSELLDANLGSLSTEFCQVSEFSNTPWAQKYGCMKTEPGNDLPFQPDDKCDSAYPDICIQSPPPDLDCADIPFRNFRVISPDPHNFDGDKDGIGCED